MGTPDGFKMKIRDQGNAFYILNTETNIIVEKKIRRTSAEIIIKETYNNDPKYKIVQLTKKEMKAYGI